MSLEVSGAEFLADEGPRAGEPDWYGGSFLLAPWAGRARPGTHGLVFGESWEVGLEDARTLSLSIEIEHELWSGTVEQRFVLTSRWLEVYACARPIAQLPTSLGFHPWFRRETDGAQPVIRAEFSHRIGAGGVPIEVAVHGEGAAARDEIYLGATASPEVCWRDGRRLVVDSDAPVWVVYEADRLGACVEPWTATPWEFDAGECLAQPDRPAELSMRLRW